MDVFGTLKPRVSRLVSWLRSPDGGLAVSNGVIAVATLPTLLSTGAAVPRLHSSVMAICLVIISLSNWRLGARWGVVAPAVAALEWLLIFTLRPI